MTTQAEAIEAAGWVLAHALARREALTPDQAAREAHAPGAPPLEAIAEVIRQQRAAKPAV